MPMQRFHASAFASPFSCCSNFLLAARIISSLLLCRFACLSLRSALHDFAFGWSASESAELWLIFEVKLYRVIRSGCVGCCGAGVALVGVAVERGSGTLNEGGAFATCQPLSNRDILSRRLFVLTLSKPLPLSARSVVAATFPPFLCKSQAISRLLS